MNCGNCGNPLEPNATFCNKCGTPVLQSNDVKVEKKKSKLVLVIVLFVVFLALGLGIGFFVGKKSVKQNKCTSEPAELKKEDKEEEKEEKSDSSWDNKKHDVLDVSKIKTSGEDELGKNIEILEMSYKESGNYLYILAKNNNTIDVDYTFYLNYLDSKGTRVDRGLTMGYVGAGKTFVTRIYNSTSDDFSGVSVSVTGKAFKSYYHLVDVENKLDIVDSDKGVVVSFKNETKNNVSIYLSIVYYKDNKIVYFEDSTISTVKPGLTENTTFSIYNLPGYSYDKVSKDLYDKYEVLVDSAFYYDTEY